MRRSRRCDPRGTRRSLRRRGAAAWSAIALALASPALAHTGLLISVPFQGAVLENPPTEISLTFRQPAAVLALVLEARNGSGRRDALVETAAPSDPATPTIPPTGIMMTRTTVVPLPPPPLTPGSYALLWRALGEDGHAVEGAIEFTLLAPSP